jgi:hypothetical protein
VSARIFVRSFRAPDRVKRTAPIAVANTKNTPIIARTARSARISGCAWSFETKLSPENAATNTAPSASRSPT